MAIESVKGAQPTQAPKKVEKKQEEKTYDGGTLCNVVCTPQGNWAYDPKEPPLLPI